MGNGMPADTNPTTAKQKLENCTTYPNMLNLTTMLTALQKPQFAIPEVNLDAANPGSFPSFDAMVNLMISKGIVPIIITYTYRGDTAFNLTRRSVQRGVGPVRPDAEVAVDRLQPGDAAPPAVLAVEWTLPG